ncbi:UNVERIFIED_CONTAM: hypothetical protein Scaly_1439600 [Sesamum calycinum]|uniref:RING-type domain-containing protein n=1 Tax=Sesamum calycinum TaxID=2727403 RepID=A0AAW2PP53_9LAMI
MAFKNIFISMLTTIFGPRTLSKSQAAAAVVECAVCLSTLEGENGRRVLPCLHEFHSVCIGRWLATPHFKNTCPVCRFPMEQDCNGGDHKGSRRQECFTEEMVIWFSSFHVAGF